MAAFDASNGEREARALAAVYGASLSRALALVIIDRIREQAKASERELRALAVVAVDTSLDTDRANRARNGSRERAI